MRTLGAALTSIVVSALTFIAMHVWVAKHLPISSLEVPSFVGMTAVQARGLAEPKGLRPVGSKVDLVVND